MRQLKKTSLTLLLTNFFLIPFSAKGLTDRIVVAINNEPYSQFDVETYIGIRVVQTQKTTVLNLSSQWNRFLDGFIDDHILLNQAKRQTTTMPNVSKKKIKSIAEKLKSNKIFQSYNSSHFKSIKLKHVEKILKEIRLIKQFVKTKKIKLANLHQSKWYKNLKNRTEYRLFDGAKRFQKLDPWN